MILEDKVVASKLSRWSIINRALGSNGYNVPPGVLVSTKYAIIARDSLITKPSSSTTGTFRCGFNLLNSSVLWSPAAKFMILIYENKSV